MIDMAKDLFFPDGNTTFGPLADMEVGLANFKCESILEFNDELKRFTLQKYIDVFIATHIRFHVQMKGIKFQQRRWQLLTLIGLLSCSAIQRILFLFDWLLR